MEYAQKNWFQAQRSYSAALKIALATNAIHPITISIYYSMGCVEFQRQNLDNAR
jgi:acid stress-induced BolA-like protein IbaG/YrbA